MQQSACTLARMAPPFHSGLASIRPGNRGASPDIFINLAQNEKTAHYTVRTLPGQNVLLLWPANRIVEIVFARHRIG